MPTSREFQPVTNPDGKPKGWTVKLYDKRLDGATPPWAATKLRQSLDHLKKNKEKLELLDIDTELVLDKAQEDDLGITILSLKQVYKDVPVYSGGIAIYLDANGQPRSFVDAKKIPGLQGKAYKDARRVDTKPKLDATQAINTAQAALGYTGAFARPPQAELMIFPHQVRNLNRPDATGGATLVYKVELLVEEDTAKTGRWWYFVNAHDGSIFWHVNAMTSGTGQGWHYGPVSFPTGYYAENTSQYYPYCERGGMNIANNGYWLWDRSGNYGRMESSDMHNTTTGDNSFPGYGKAVGVDDSWGISIPGAYCNGWARDRPQVDVQYSMAVTWDYFVTQHGLRGIDGGGYKMIGRAHWGNNDAEARWNGSTMNFGDGPGNTSPRTVLDIVGHEWTHGVTEKSSGGLNYDRESGAANESFSDIFGTMIEFLANNPSDPPDYLIAEKTGTAYRDMGHPPRFGDPDHYNDRQSPGYCNPNGGNDFCGVHHNSGIQNKAFYLLAEGGWHNGVYVPGIGRGAAAEVFYRVLTSYLTNDPAATFHDLRLKTVWAAEDRFGWGSQASSSAGLAWDAVGIPRNQIDESWFFVRWHYKDFMGREPDQGGWDYWSNQINRNCGKGDRGCIERKRVDVSRAFWYDPEFYNARPGLRNSPGVYPDFDNREFVRQCYLVYLKKQPDQPGWDFWTNELNQNNDYDHIISAFITTGGGGGYRDRF